MIRHSNTKHKKEMVVMTPYEELGKVLKLKRKGDESFDSFTARTTKKINALADPEWNELTEKVQLWHNQTMEIREKGGDHIDEDTLPALEGWPDNKETEETEGEPGEPEGDSEDDDSEPENKEQPPGGEDDEPAEESEEPSEESVDAAVDSEQEAPDEAKAPEAKATKAKPKRAAKKAPVAAKTEKPKTSTPKVKEKETMPAKKTVVTKAVVAKKAATASARTRIGDSDTIKLLAKTNPYREGSLGAKVFAKYKDGMKVKQFADGVAKLDTSRPAVALLRYDIAKGYVKVQSAA
jgi:hypothetical protein